MDDDKFVKLPTSNLGGEIIRVDRNKVQVQCQLEGGLTIYADYHADTFSQDAIINEDLIVGALVSVDVEYVKERRQWKIHKLSLLSPSIVELQGQYSEVTLSEESSESGDNSESDPEKDDYPESDDARKLRRSDPDTSKDYNVSSQPRPQRSFRTGPNHEVFDDQARKTFSDWRPSSNPASVASKKNFSPTQAGQQRALSSEQDQDRKTDCRQFSNPAPVAHKRNFIPSPAGPQRASNVSPHQNQARKTHWHHSTNLAPMDSKTNVNPSQAGPQRASYANPRQDQARKANWHHASSPAPIDAQTNVTQPQTGPQRASYAYPRQDQARKADWHHASSPAPIDAKTNVNSWQAGPPRASNASPHQDQFRRSDRCFSSNSAPIDSKTNVFPSQDGPKRAFSAGPHREISRAYDGKSSRDWSNPSNSASSAPKTHEFPSVPAGPPPDYAMRQFPSARQDQPGHFNRKPFDTDYRRNRNDPQPLQTTQYTRGAFQTPEKNPQSGYGTKLEGKGTTEVLPTIGHTQHEQELPALKIPCTIMNATGLVKTAGGIFKTKFSNGRDQIILRVFEHSDDSTIFEVGDEKVDKKIITDLVQPEGVEKNCWIDAVFDGIKWTITKLSMPSKTDSCVDTSKKPKSFEVEEPQIHSEKSILDVIPLEISSPSIDCKGMKKLENKSQPPKQEKRPNCLFFKGPKPIENLPKPDVKAFTEKACPDLMVQPQTLEYIVTDSVVVQAVSNLSIKCSGEESKDKKDPLKEAEPNPSTKCALVGQKVDWEEVNILDMTPRELFDLLQ